METFITVLSWVLDILFWIGLVVFIFDLYNTFKKIEEINNRISNTEKLLERKLDEINKSLKDIIRISNFQN
jgi:hypothetical protein